MINRQVMSSTLASIKANIGRLKDDAKVVGGTPEFAKVSEKCKLVLAKLVALKQSMSNALSKLWQNRKPKPSVPTVAKVSAAPANKSAGRLGQMRPSYAREESAQERTGAKLVSSVGSLFSGLRKSLGWVVPRAIVAAIAIAAAWAIWRAYQLGDFVSVAAVLMVAAGAMFGYWRGIAASIISLVGIVVVYFTAPQLGVAYEHLVSETFGTTGILNRGLAVGAAGLLVFLVFNLISTLVLKLLTKKSDEKSSIVDQTLGLVGGAAQATLCVLLFLSGMLVIKPMLPTTAELTEETTAAHRISTLSAAIEQSQLLPWVERYNLFENSSQLNKVTEIQHTIGQLDSPDQVRQLMRHPSVMELRKDPEMKKAVEGLAAEPEFVELMTGKKPLNSTASTLLRSDAVLKLIEQPGFLETAREILSASSETGSLRAQKKSDGSHEPSD